MRRRTAVLGVLAVVVVVVLGGFVWIVRANTFDYDESKVSIPVADALSAGGTTPDAHTAGRLEGVLTTPKGHEGRFGLIVLVHGDGPANATRDDAYKPLSEAFARAGYATLAWKKPGVDGAPGDWLSQSLADRGAEVAAALDWAGQQADVDPTRIGAWGISQAGWVLPSIAARRPDLRFLILVGVAVNWLEQGEFNLRADLNASHATEEERVDALDRRDRTIALLERGVDYRTYLESNVDDPPMTADRWGFVRRNFRADATADIASIAVPTLLVLGGADRNVDTEDTARVYRARMRTDLLSERPFPGATHSITRDNIEYRASELSVLARAAFSPRSIYARGYLDALAEFVHTQGNR